LGQVVVSPLFFDHSSRLGQVVELVVVQAFFLKLAVEALNVGVLCWFTWVDEGSLTPLCWVRQSIGLLVNSGSLSMINTWGRLVTSASSSRTQVTGWPEM